MDNSSREHDRQCAIHECAGTATPESNRLPICDWHDREFLLDKADKHEAERQAKKSATPLNRVNELVYYIRMGGHVKIGKSTNLKKRMESFYAQPRQLLAVEPCVVHDGLTREKQRHHEFTYCRVGKTELFLETEELRDHMAGVVATFGDPQQYI